MQLSRDCLAALAEISDHRWTRCPVGEETARPASMKDRWWERASTAQKSGTPPFDDRTCETPLPVPAPDARPTRGLIPDCSPVIPCRAPSCLNHQTGDLNHA